MTEEENKQIAAKDEKIAELHSWADSMLRKIEVLEAQIAEQDFVIQQTQIDRDTWRSNYHGVAEQIAAKDAALREARIWLINWPNYVAKIDAALAAPARETK